MNKYGIAAINAVKLYRSGLAKSPEDAWAQATVELFGIGTWSQRKACPKGAFLGLCEEGLVNGIRQGHYTDSQKNKKYAIDAVAILNQNPALAKDLGRLWDRVMNGEVKKHNDQMNVVVSLWNEALIRKQVKP